jgi:hypothetical protein
MTLHHSLKSRFSLIVLLLVMIGSDLFAQRMYHTDNSMRMPDFIGISPSFYRDSSYAKGRVDFNILPFTWTYQGNGIVDYRQSLQFYLGRREDGTRYISGYGVEFFALPIYLKPSGDEYLPNSGIYIAPVANLLFTRSPTSFAGGGIHLGLWGEAGYQYLLSDEFSVSLGLQLGRTLHTAEFFDGVFWSTHFGVKFTIGAWLNW